MRCKYLGRNMFWGENGLGIKDVCYFFKSLRNDNFIINVFNLEEYLFRIENNN